MIKYEYCERNNTKKETAYYSNYTIEHTGTSTIDPFDPIGDWHYYWPNGLKRMVITNEPRTPNGKKITYKCWTSKGDEIPDCEFLDSRLK